MRDNTRCLFSWRRVLGKGSHDRVELLKWTKLTQQIFLSLNGGKMNEACISFQVHGALSSFINVR